RLVLPSGTAGADLRGASDSVRTGGATWPALRCGTVPVSAGSLILQIFIYSSTAFIDCYLCDRNSARCFRYSTEQKRNSLLSWYLHCRGPDNK
ncbi:unnamed protein product, partial [Gulo gulo]